LAKQATGKDPFMGTSESTVVVNHPLADLQNHLVNAEVEQEVIKAKIKATQELGSQAAPISDAIIENKINVHPEVLRLKQDLLVMRSQLRNLESVSVRKADRQQLTREITETEASLQQLRKDLQSQIRAEIQSASAAKRDEQIAALKTDLESRRIAAEMLRKRYENQITDVKQTSGETLQLRFKQGELQRAEKIYELISERIVRLRTEIGAPERVICMHRADAPSTPIEVFPLTNILLAAIAGFAAPFGLALGVEKLIHRVGDASNLETASRLPVVGEIARLPARRRIDRPRDSLQMGLDLRMFEESVNSLRTTLMLAEELRDLRVLAVTSATTHEGKTSVAVQFAMSVARATQQPTLLIDGDMRSPNLHDIFGVKLEPGLTKVLEGRASVEEAIVATSCPSLDLLPAGFLTSNPHQLLGNSTAAALLQSVPDKYRYVIVDTPPVLAASESLMLAAIADATLVCVLRDVSRIDQIQKAYKRLSLSGGKPVGLVLNGVPTKAYAQYYGTYGMSNR
jgi:capsular exopolysaccharide synthesis family protein